MSENIEDDTKSNNCSTDTSGDPESIIDRFLDVINIKRLLTIIFNKTPFKVTNSFVSGFILLIFLLWLFYLADELSKFLIVLVLCFFLFLDILGKNVDFVKQFLFSEDSNRAYLKNISKCPLDDAERQTRIRRFTPSNITHYLNEIKQNPKIECGFVLENLVLYNDLSNENFEILFSEEFLKHDLLQRDTIKKILMRYKDKISKKFIHNLYVFFKTDEMILKYIFATQKESEFLIKENEILKEYQEKFRVNSNPNFKKIKENLPNYPKARSKLFSDLSSLAMILWLFTTSIVILFFNSHSDFILPNGYINPIYSAYFLIIIAIALIYSISMVYLIWQIFSESQIKNWESFMLFVDAA